MRPLPTMPMTSPNGVSMRESQSVLVPAAMKTLNARRRKAAAGRDDTTRQDRAAASRGDTRSMARASKLNRNQKNAPLVSAIVTAIRGHAESSTSEIAQPAATNGPATKRGIVTKSTINSPHARSTSNIVTRPAPSKRPGRATAASRIKYQTPTSAATPTTPTRATAAETPQAAELVAEPLEVPSRPPNGNNDGANKPATTPAEPHSTPTPLATGVTNPLIFQVATTAIVTSRTSSGRKRSGRRAMRANASPSRSTALGAFVSPGGCGAGTPLAFMTTPVSRSVLHRNPYGAPAHAPASSALPTADRRGRRSRAHAAPGRW